MVLTISEPAKKFGMSEATARIICAMKGSPAYKAGTGKTAPWRCDEDSFEAFLLANAEGSKG